jgi:N-dimethylarginine dimethylaminohydrolase
MSIPLHINDEVSRLDSVILGIGTDPGEQNPHNPKSSYYMEMGAYPTRKDILEEINDLEKALLENGVKVFRPKNLKKRTQIFCRDLGFVIGDDFFLSTMTEARSGEQEGIHYLVELIGKEKITDLSLHKNISAEGGDIILFRNMVFVGLSDRTNDEAYEFLKERYKGGKEVVQIKVVTDNNDHWEHSAHLDCVFQPVGSDYAIVYEKGIKNLSALYDNLGIPDGNIFKCNQWEFVSMVPNVLSINSNTVVLEKEFIGLSYWLKERAFNIIEVKYKEISKLGGSFRCSTLPLQRY